MKCSISSSLYFPLLWMCIYLISSSSGHSQEIGDSLHFYEKIMLNPHKDSNIEAAFSYFEEEHIKDLKNNNLLEAVIKLRYLSIGQYEMGAIYESETTAIKALKLMDGLPNNKTNNKIKIGFYVDLGKVYRTLKSPANAIRYYERALKFCEDGNDSLSIHNNIGNVFTDMGNYGLAQKQFKKAYEKSLLLSESPAQAQIIDNLGFAQSKSLHPDALENMLLALEMRQRFQVLSGIYSSYRHLAIHFNDRNSTEEALEYAQKAYEVAKNIDSPSYIENSLINLLKINGDPTAKEFIRLNDSIENARLQRQNKYAAMQYNISKEKEKTEANRLLQEKEKRKKQTYQFLGILALLIGIGIYFFQRYQNKKKTLEQIYNTETRISKKVHDEVANDVYHLMNKIQRSLPDNEVLLDDLEEIYKKTRDISRENSELFIQEEFTTQLKGLIQNYQNGNVVITILNISKVNWKPISDSKKIALYRIVQELLTNMKKHSQATHVLLSFIQNRNELQIKYVDNGVGCLLKNKNGLQNTENRIKAINGSIIFDSAPQKGFKSTITI